jgi:hypothetical protein
LTPKAGADQYGHRDGWRRRTDAVVLMRPAAEDVLHNAPTLIDRIDL